ncbi:MAG: hypothetical protein ACU83U_07225 [Gammaproteobacteria bacterium]
MQKAFIVLNLALLLAACTSTDTLSLYRDMTKDKSQLEVRSGEPTQFSGSEKMCITATCKSGDKDCEPTENYNGSPLMAGSNYAKYYDLTLGDNGYFHYGSDSQYAKDLTALTKDMDQLMASFSRTGLRQELERHNKTPALMFDLDNTLDFSAEKDDDPMGNKPAIKAMVDFANRWCFKDGLACYFVTARNCDVNSATSAEKWLKANLNLDDEKLRRYTYFSRNTQNLVCTIPDNPTVAYKDVIREALEQQEQVFWLMSVGDQLTDSLGEHSGMKVRVPNQFFHADVSPNQWRFYGRGQCGSPTTIAPPRDCAESLIDHALKYSSLEYCRAQPAPIELN